MGSFRVLIPKDLADIVSSAMLDREDTIIGNKVFQFMESNEMGSGESVDVILNNLPQPSIAQLVSESIQAGLVRTLLVPVGLSISLALLLLLGYKKVSSSEFGYSTGSKRTSLATDIAFLDDQFERGEIDEIEYKEERLQLKTKLLGEVQLEENKR